MLKKSVRIVKRFSSIGPRGVMLEGFGFSVELSINSLLIIVQVLGGYKI
jgi:hypothetical protein